MADRYRSDATTQNNARGFVADTSVPIVADHRENVEESAMEDDERRQGVSTVQLEEGRGEVTKGNGGRYRREAPCECVALMCKAGALDRLLLVGGSVARALCRLQAREFLFE